MVATPFLGMEYAVSQRVHLVAKADYIFNIAEKQTDFANGIRIYAGFVFFHADMHREKNITDIFFQKK
jgi:hypothetical protein